jgi:lysozyme
MTITPNQVAFLAMLRNSEGTDKAPNAYAVTFGNQYTITDFRDHPSVLGLWDGLPLDFLGPQYAGLKSTAAGAYQFIKPTWLGCRAKLALPDFSPASQDQAALYLIGQAGALDAIEAGNLDAAVAACRHIWASLPGGAAGQPHATADALAQIFVANGGVLAA